MGELLDSAVTVPQDEAKIDQVSQEYMDVNPDRNVDKNVGFISDYAGRERDGKRKLLTIRFLVSPTEIIVKTAE